MNDHALTKIREFREQRVLVDIEGHRLDQKDGVILVTCADGDQFADIFMQQSGMQRDQRDNPRVHPLSWHGGPLRLLTDSRTNRHGHEAETFLNEIRDAPGIKQMKTVALCSHYPCSKAKGCNMTVEEVIDATVQVKKRIKREMPGIGVACFFHVDYPAEAGMGARKRTYFLGRHRWETTQTGLAVPADLAAVLA
jgi:hypothetical protein